MCFMCVLSIKVPIRKKVWKLINDPHICNEVLIQWCMIEIDLITCQYTE